MRRGEFPCKILE